MTHPYRIIPELGDLQAGGPIVRIPAGQDIPFTARVRALVDTAEFQRLRSITQLGLAARIYPGATHSRFEHALGVFHNALRYLWQLGKDQRFAAAVDVHQAEVLMAAALLHDLGHWPFCHPIEDMCLPDLPPHEVFAKEFLSQSRELAQVLKTEWQIEPEEVLDVLVPKTDSTTLHLMRSILSGPIDIDKMDYLERDSLHAGVSYGRNFDRNRLIQSLLVNEAGDGLAISSKGKTAAELMVFARYVMFSEVYWHHAVRSATSMFARSFFEVYRNLDLQTLFQQSEFEVIAALRREAMGTPVAPLLDGVFGPRRNLHKRVVEFSLNQTPELYRSLAGRPYFQLVEVCDRLTKIVERHLGHTLQPTDLLIDAPPRHKEVEFKVDIFHPKEKYYRPLSHVSPVVAALAKTQFDDYVKRVRVFAEPKLAQELNGRGEFVEWLSTASEF
ncbi:MAG: HD domain-containing protein [Planctomycetales bacterium]|jgi:HD superfamily phosphohydrolase|nr:HD domain-containing protein [Planctomycetales bacterium]